MIDRSKIKFIFLFFIIFFVAIYLFFINPVKLFHNNGASRKTVPRHADFLEEKQTTDYADSADSIDKINNNTKEEAETERAINNSLEKNSQEDKKSLEVKDILPSDKIVEDYNALEQKFNFLKIELDVPFTPQAPFGDWSDPYFQDGCEEASSLMAVYWARGEVFNLEEAKKEIIAASRYEEEKINEFMDASMEDTLAIIIKGYFGYEKAELKKDIFLSDIILELINGNVVIAHTNGQLLGNPYYTSPGPDRHSLVIAGYDEETKEFIVNDPGTKRGEKFRYNEDVLYNAIRDYPTGHHDPIENIQKNMIVIKPE